MSRAAKVDSEAPGLLGTESAAAAAKAEAKAKAKKHQQLARKVPAIASQEECENLSLESPSSSARDHSWGGP